MKPVRRRAVLLWHQRIVCEGETTRLPSFVVMR
jgi:hypothetical protein